MRAEIQPDARQLRATLRDLVALSAIPSAWTGKDPPAIATGLANTVVELLQLDFAFVRLTGVGGSRAVEARRGSASPSFADWLARQLAASANLRRKEVVADADGGSDACRGLAIPVGVDGERGLVAAACGRTDFPTFTDELLLSLAANHAATAFQTACAEEALRQARNELETKVAERTAEVGQLAEEQAALRHVAVLVARQPSPDEIFTAVTEAVGPLLGADLAAMHAFDGDEAAAVIAGWSAAGPMLPIGTRLPLDGDSVAARIFQTCGPARMDDYTDVEGGTADIARGLRLRSTVGAPILVEGKLWGALIAATRGLEPLPADAETRIAAFTELVATSVSNAQAREDLHRLAEEQAALRRVAMLVAKEASPAEVFAKVAEEAAGALGDLDCGLLRNDGDGNATVVAASGDAIWASFPVGARMPVDGDGVVASVLRQGRPCRIDNYAADRGVVAEGARKRGIGSAVGCPVVVRSDTWGALVIATSGARPCPPETERRIAQFADLVATAIGNAEARAEVSRLANEQAALRRVATLVAQGARPAEVFAAVSEEVGRLFGSDTASVVRFEYDHPAIVIVGASSNLKARILGTRLDIDEPLAAAEVFRTGRSARIDNWDLAARTSAVGDEIRRLGVASTVASPIVVEGRRWGTISVASTGEPLPLDAGERLERFSELVATAVANTDSRLELAASRKRIVAASDEARRRIERDLHDGTQQRLVSLGLAMRAAEAAVGDDRPDLRDELSRLASGLGDAVTELQEISRGIHPVILGQGGLGPALRTLARRSTIPVELDVTTDVRLPDQVEVAAYYVASEALANAGKHARASRIDIRLRRGDGALHLEIRDDGVGGAAPQRGSGLVGLGDRVEALGGSIRVESPPGEGTRIAVELPVELEDRPGR